MTVDFGHGFTGVGRGSGEKDGHRAIDDPAVHGEDAIGQHSGL